MTKASKAMTKILPCWVLRRTRPAWSSVRAEGTSPSEPENALQPSPSSRRSQRTTAGTTDQPAEAPARKTALHVTPPARLTLLGHLGHQPHRCGERFELVVGAEVSDGLIPSGLARHFADLDLGF